MLIRNILIIWNDINVIKKLEIKLLKVYISLKMFFGEIVGMINTRMFLKEKYQRFLMKKSKINLIMK
jgi:hypothetical protein